MKQTMPIAHSLHYLRRFVRKNHVHNINMTRRTLDFALCASRDFSIHIEQKEFASGAESGG